MHRIYKQNVILLFITIFCLNSVQASNKHLFLKAGFPVSGFSGLIQADKKHIYLSNGLYKNVISFNLKTKKFEESFDLPGFSFPRDVAKIPFGFSVTSFLDGRVWTFLDDGTRIESNPGPFISCIPCGSTPVTYDPTFFALDPIAYRASNDRLYIATSSHPEAIYKLDWRGTSYAEAIPLTPPTRLRAYSFGPDGFLYAPVFSSGKIVKIDVDTGIVTDVLTGLTTPASVKIDEDGILYIISRTTGVVYTYDPVENILEELATLKPALDNLLIDNENKKVYVTNELNTIFSIDINSGNVKEIFKSRIRGPGELVLEGDSLYVADTTSLKEFDAYTRDLKREIIVDDEESPSLIRFGQVTGLTVEEGEQGKIILTDITLGHVRVINKSDFSLYESFPASQSGLFGKQPLSAVRVLGGSPEEYYLVANAVDGTIVKLYREEGVIISDIYFSGLNAPAKLKIFDDHLYVVEAGRLMEGIPDSGQISRIRLIDHPTPADRKILVEGLDNPQGLDIYCQTMIITEVGKKRILEAKALEYSLPTVLYDNLKTGRSPLVSFQNPVPIVTPAGIAVNSEGSRIYVTQDVPNNILLIKNED